MNSSLHIFALLFIGVAVLLPGVVAHLATRKTSYIADIRLVLGTLIAHGFWPQCTHSKGGACCLKHLGHFGPHYSDLVTSLVDEETGAPWTNDSYWSDDDPHDYAR